MLLKLIPAGLLAAVAWANVINDVRQAAAQNNFALGDSILQKYRASQGVTPEMIVAMSWMGRGAFEAKKWDKADSYAKETERLSLEELKKRPLDAEPYLPLALGAAIEVEAQVLSQRGDRGAAIAYLRTELAKYHTTSIRTRIQKNINLLSLEGKPAPVLDEREFLGANPTPLASLKGKPVMLFFWAHWCGDCKQESPILAEIRKEYAAKGLVVVAPTQRYGYVARGEEAALCGKDQVHRRGPAQILSGPAECPGANQRRELQELRREYDADRGVDRPARHRPALSSRRDDAGRASGGAKPVRLGLFYGRRDYPDRGRRLQIDQQEAIHRYRPADDPGGCEQFGEVEHHAAVADAEADFGTNRPILVRYGSAVRTSNSTRMISFRTTKTGASLGNFHQPVRVPDAISAVELLVDRGV